MSNRTAQVEMEREKDVGMERWKSSDGEEYTRVSIEAGHSDKAS